MNTRIERIKEHFKRNKKEYICVAAGVVGTLLIVIVKNKLGQIQSVTAIETQVNSDVTYIKMEKNYLYLGGRTGNVGRPGQPVRDIDDKILYRSITDASKKTGFSESSISRNVNGKQEHVNGHHFIKVFVDAWHPGEENLPIMEPEYYD